MARAAPGRSGADALEHATIARLLCAVQRDRLVTGITTGLVPAAAVLGMVLGFGMRAGAPARGFVAVGETFLGSGAVGGALLLLVLALLCGLAYISLVARERQHWLAWAITIGAVATIVMLVWSRARGGGIALVLSTGNLFEIGVVIAITLPIGMRFALPQV